MLERLIPRSLLTAFSLLSLLILMLGACAAPVPQPSISTNVTKGGTWIVDLLHEPDSLIPNASSETFSDMIDQSIYTPLFYGDSNGTLHPGLAKEIPTLANGGISPDLKTWTIHLKPNLVWSDGMPLNANDVDFTWKLWNNAHFNATNTVGFNLISSADVSADNLTIVFHLKQSFSPFISLWADGLYAPLPAHHYNNVAPDQILKSADNFNPSVTSGPFMMSESVPGDHYTVIRNTKYYRASEGLPYLDKVIFRIVSDQNKVLKDFQAGTIDSGWLMNVTNPVAYQRLTHYSLIVNPKSTNFEALYFNFHNPILAENLDVRKAIAMAIDHQALIKTARYGQAVQHCTDHSPALQPGYQANALCPTFNVNAANTLLDRDGWVRGADGYRSKDHQKLEFRYSTTIGNPWRGEDEVILQQDLALIGIKLDIKNYPAITFYLSFLTDGKPGTYDIAEFENSFNYNADDSSMLSCNQVPPNGFNIDFYCNKALDALYTQEQETVDPTVRQNIFNQIHQIYLTEFPFITLYNPLDMFIVKKGTHNYLPAPEGALETINIWEWWCDRGQCPA
ncbi:MAG TPA: ABC transporter substrate-binding protein [Ktedonobacter sp.]|jgi:peptide/nickel transport system substrate-binding protein|nr:ABC transporter substrate-binding protein [Ktedonobacter sp.]HCJ33203.1 ABC transporter substrate-binding protein [Ktedonobacter sp.]